MGIHNARSVRQDSRMKSYLASGMEERRQALGDEILRWSGITTSVAFGCPCYNADGKLFAFLVTNGIVITALGHEDRTTIARTLGAAPFQARRGAVRTWVQVPYLTPAKLDPILRYLRASYEAARTADSTTDKGKAKREGRAAQSRSRKSPRT